MSLFEDFQVLIEVLENIVPVTTLSLERIFTKIFDQNPASEDQSESPRVGDNREEIEQDQEIQIEVVQEPPQPHHHDDHEEPSSSSDSSYADSNSRSPSIVICSDPEPEQGHDPQNVSGQEGPNLDLDMDHDALLTLELEIQIERQNCQRAQANLAKLETELIELKTARRGGVRNAPSLHE